MDCPKCTVQLDRIERAGVKVLMCRQCKGHLIEKHRVAKIEKRINKDPIALAKEIRAADGDDTVQDIRCPRCRNRMDKKAIQPKSHLMIDECRNCDFVWLDGGEIARIEMAFEMKDQTVELNRMRERLASMTAEERTEYENRIANLMDTSTELEIMSAVKDELVYRFFFDSFRFNF